MSREVPKRPRSAHRPSEPENPSAGDDKTPASPGRRTPPWEREAENDSASFGTWLRRQREAREISLRDIAERTKIGIRYLEALEEDRLDVLPAPIFTKGFLREYARYIGLSPDEAVNHYLAYLDSRGVQDTGDAKELVRARPRPASGRWTFVFFLVVTALLLAVLVLFSRQVEKRRAAPDSLEERPPIAAPPAAPAPPPPSAPAVQQNAPLEVNLEFTGKCWVERSIDGARRIAENRVEGESLRIEAKESVVLTLGNAGAVQIQVNGNPLPLSKGPGEVLTDLKIDLELARSLEKAGETR